MGVFKYFPYTNFHELNLNWIIEKTEEAYNQALINKQEMDKILSIISDPLTEEQKEELYQYILDLIDEKGLDFVEKWQLTSNDIDVECVSEYVMEDGSNSGTGAGPYYSIAESMAIMDDGSMFIAFVDERTTHDDGFASDLVTLRHYSSTYGDVLGNQNFQVRGGHANGLCTNGTDKLYIAWTNQPDGHGGTDSSRRVSICTYNDHTGTLSFDPTSDIKETLNTTVGITYDKDNDYVITWDGSTGFDVYTKDLVHVRFVPCNYKSAYLDDTKQDLIWYHGLVGVCRGWANLLTFYDISGASAKLVKVYNIPRFTPVGTPFCELESGDFYGGDFYLMSFNRLGDSTLNHWNLVKFNPWTNVNKQYHYKNRYNGNFTIYVDPGTNTHKQTGTTSYPFCCISQALAAFKQMQKQGMNPLIALRKGELYEGVKVIDTHDLRITAWNREGDESLPKPGINGIMLQRCSNMVIGHFDVVKSTFPDSGTGDYVVSIRRCTGQMSNIEYCGNETCKGIHIYDNSDMLLKDSTIDAYCTQGLIVDTNSIVRINNLTNNATVKKIQVNSGSVVYAPERKIDTTNFDVKTFPYPRNLPVTVLAGGTHGVGSHTLDVSTVSGIWDSAQFAVLTLGFPTASTTDVKLIPITGTTNVFRVSTARVVNNKMLIGTIEGNIELTSTMEDDEVVKSGKLNITQMYCYDSSTGTLYTAGQQGIPATPNVYLVRLM